MTPQIETALNALYRIDEKAEIVNGGIVRMSPTGRKPGRVSKKILIALCDYERATRRGEAFGDNVGFAVTLPGRTAFSPDAAFHTGPIDWSDAEAGDFIEGAPTFAVEVRSKFDYGKQAEDAMAAKRADYFAAGTLVVWDVDVLRGKVIRVYRADAPDTPTEYRVGDLADAEPALPGWRVPVGDIFD